MVFRNRTEAGARLGQILLDADLRAPVLLGLPRGGVIVTAGAASVLGTTFDAFVALKIGYPRQEELGVGAVAEGLGQPILSDVAAQVGISDRELAELARRPLAEVERRVGLYRKGRPLPDMSGKQVVVIDDGLATGVTAEAALRAITRRGPERLVLAVPVCAPDTAARLLALTDDVVCIESPEDLRAVGMWYRDFTPTTDDEVLAALSLVHPPADSPDR